MVKHVSFIIGCIILSLSITLIVPTNGSSIEEIGQKETNFAKSRSKRSISQASSGASSSSEASATTQSVSPNPYLALLPLLSKLSVSGGQQMTPQTSFGGLPSIVNGLDPVLSGLAIILQKLGFTLNGVVGGVDNILPLDTGFLQQIIAKLFGSTGGMNTPILNLGNSQSPLSQLLVTLFSQPQLMTETRTTNAKASASSTASAGSKTKMF